MGAFVAEHGADSAALGTGGICWAGFPFVMMMILAGLQGISGEMYESSAIDGANRIQQFFLHHHSVPALRNYHGGGAGGSQCH